MGDAGKEYEMTGMAWIEARFREFGDREMAVGDDGAVTYAQFVERIVAWRVVVREWGLVGGDSVGLVGDYSAFDLVAGVTSAVATQALSADQTATLRATRQATLETAETAALGVDLDYELQELNLIQTAYAANARVMQAVDEMMRRLLEI